MPGNASSAASSASRLSRSRWFVGSSSRSRFAPGGDDEREREPPALAAREHRDRPLVHLPAREEEPAEEVLRLRALEPGGVLRDGEHGPALVELDLVLREVRRLDAVAEPQLSGDGLPAAEQGLEQRRLARAVRPDERDVLAPLDRERDVCEELLVAGGELDAVGLDDRAAAPLRLEELEAEALRPPREQRDLAADLGPLLLEAADLRQLRLGALGEVLLVAEALDEALEAGDVDVDSGCAGRRGRGQRAPPSRGASCARARRSRSSGRPRARAPRSSPPRGTSGRGRRGRPRRRSTASSRSSHSRLATSRWFVGSSRSRRSGSPPSARASEARVSSPPENVDERALEVGRREAEVARDRVEPLAPGVAARVLEPGLGLGVAPERRRLVVAGGHRLLEPARAPARRRSGRPRPRGRSRGARRALSAGGRWSWSAMRVPFAMRELAAVELGLAVQDPEQGRLARAVRPGERDSVPAPDLEGDPVEERVAGELLAEVGCGDDGHALRVEAARIHRFGAETAQTCRIARDTLTAGGGWSSPHPGGDVGEAARSC